MHFHDSVPDLCVAVSPLSPVELDAMRAVARLERGAGTLAYDAIRLGFLKARSLGRLDADAAFGLSLLEADMVMNLAREPARTVRQLRVKAAIIRDRVGGEPADDNLAAMLFAALHADAARLGVAPDEAGAHA